SILQSKKSKYTKCKFNEMIKLIGNIDLIWILQLIYEIFRLRGIFSNEHGVFNQVKNSCSSGYYTPKEVITFIYSYLTEVCNFKGGDILEPSCGNGVFFKYMPKGLRANSSITGIELDCLTSKIAQGIYSDIAIINQPLQEVDFIDRKYDLIIGNPPYSHEVVTDNFMPDISNYTIHHYFVAKCVRLLKDEGILALVLPCYYLDVPRRNTRAIVNNEAVLIDVVRLPENLFTQATVTVDIVFIRKSGKRLHNFVNTVLLEQDGNKDSINEYWQTKPQRILGELKLKWVECYKRHVPTCVTSDINQVFNVLTNCRFSSETKQNYSLIAG
ncbi:MAG: hypothetical protein QG673_1896, partial [Pseudomonadota bacterium]|nr:hypothetical protein [Pseudomonadota bacterium]